MQTDLFPCDFLALAHKSRASNIAEIEVKPIKGPDGNWFWRSAVNLETAGYASQWTECDKRETGLCRAISEIVLFTTDARVMRWLNDLTGPKGS